MTVEDFLELFDHVEQHPGGWKVVCPAHADGSPSLGVTEGENGEILLTCYADCSTESVLAAMNLSWADLFPNSKSWGEPEAVYPYVDEGGNTLYEAVRFPPKNGKKVFTQRHMGEDGKYVYNLDGVRRVLYRLPSVVAAAAASETVYLCEGEKDVLALVAAGVVATCNPMGAGKWRKEYNDALVGANVIIIADKDEVGRRHAHNVRESLRASNVLVSIMEAKEGKDAADHLGAGFGVDDFVPIIDRVRRGIVTAREMSATGLIHAKSVEGTIVEYVVPDFQIGRNALAFRPGRPYSVGAYTGDGKTTFAMQVTRTLCSQDNPPRIGYFTLEMSSDDLRNRFVEHWGLPLHVIEHPWLMTDTQRYTYKAAIAQMREWPLEVIFDTGANADSICTTARDREYDFVIVDHLHRFSWGGDRRTLENEITQLTNLALDFNVPVLVLAQLRATRSGQGKFETYPKPSLATFKETSVLGEEAALSLAVWRHRVADGAQYDPQNLSSLLVLKNRYGPTTETTLQLDTERMLFVPGGYAHERGTDTGQGLPDGSGQAPDDPEDY